MLFVWLHIWNAFQGSQRELLNLSQQDYANRIEELNQSLKEAWAADQKVKALKIVIQVVQQQRDAHTAPTSHLLFTADLSSVFQCAKLLSDTSVIQFYPSKFVLITDILDTFGEQLSLVGSSVTRGLLISALCVSRPAGVW